MFLCFHNCSVPCWMLQVRNPGEWRDLYCLCRKSSRLISDFNYSSISLRDIKGQLDVCTAIC
jgi:hypothetical protein